MTDSQSTFNSMDFRGMDIPGLFSIIERDLRPNPITGEYDEGSIVRAMSRNMGPELEKIIIDVGAVQDTLKSVDLSTYDFAALAGTVEVDTVWVLSDASTRRPRGALQARCRSS
ncbi:hypothetical protein BV25DRAFT_1914484 [Artomyces pyxidatus]|uniref:Uncharacterized protein n=1 Tax=Artomyces pyxidatus TaxID=48021 RepID=A0ACB8T718_9AGAM|nr:hypothetical protein BV25DRAFT_1914484 [Artomyces pyxidatus]